MAVTKVLARKGRLDVGIHYVLNGDKTNEQILTAYLNCDPGHACRQMLDTKRAMGKTDGVQYYHLIQSFKPGEVTPELALEIAKEFAEEHLAGYEAVIGVHVDKEHIHAHTIFNSVNADTGEKYHSNARSYYSQIRAISDRLCREHGLSVVQPSRDKGKSYAEWDAGRKGKSWKAKLKAAIDAVIPQAKNFDDFLRLMAAQGYEIKQGKFISFRAPGQERFTRCKTLGENYTEEAITSRIKGLAVDRGPNRQRKGITLRIDLENNIKAQQSAGYARWAKLQNLKQAAKTMNFLTEHGIEQYAELESKVMEISAVNDEAAAALKDVERRLGDMAVLIKNLTTYKQFRPVVLEYRKAKDKAAFRREHESQLILYEAAAKAIKDAGITRLPDLAALKAEYRELDKQKARLYEQYGEVKRELKEYGIIKQNVDSILRVTPGKEQAQEL